MAPGWRRHRRRYFCGKCIAPIYKAIHIRTSYIAWRESSRLIYIIYTAGRPPPTNSIRLARLTSDTCDRASSTTKANGRSCVPLDTSLSVICRLLLYYTPTLLLTYSRAVTTSRADAVCYASGDEEPSTRNSISFFLYKSCSISFFLVANRLANDSYCVDLLLDKL